MKKLYFIFAFLLSACVGNNVITHCVRVKTDFASDMNIKKYNKCYIESKNDLKSIEGKRVYNLLSESLKKKGIQIEKNKKSANCIIFMAYGTEIKSYISSEAIWGNTGYKSSQSSYDSITNTINTTYTPSFGVIGYAPVQKNVPLHYLSMSATTKDTTEIWNSTAVYNVGDFELVVPMLVEVSTHLLGKRFNSNFCYGDSDLILMQQGRNDEIQYLPTP